MSQQIALLTDYIHSDGATYTALGKLFGFERIRLVNAAEIAGGYLDREPVLFVIPGGASRYKIAQLRGESFARIRRYVSAGGSFLGICGGAYMACAKTVWAAGSEHEIISTEGLALGEIDAIGPIEDFATANDRNGTAPLIVPLRFRTAEFPVLYWGGAQFIGRSSNAMTTEATFFSLPEQPAAIVSGSYGRGRWLLSSPHIEWDREAVELVKCQVVDNQYEQFLKLSSHGLTLEILETLVRELM